MGITAMKNNQKKYEIIGCTYKINTKYNVPNWNYNPKATKDNGIQIPYYDLNNDGEIDIKDLILVIEDYISPVKKMNTFQLQRFNEPAKMKVNLKDIVKIINVINKND